MEKNLAKITKFWLGIDDHGILGMSLTMEFEDDCGVQCYSGYGYTHHDRKTDKTIGHASLAEHIYALCEAFGVYDPHHLVGKHCYVYKENFFAFIDSIESLKSDGGKVVDFKKITKEVMKREGYNEE